MNAGHSAIRSAERDAAVAGHEESHRLRKHFAGVHVRAARPNPSLNRSANGRPPGPATRYGVHFLVAGPGVLPSAFG